MDSTAISRLPGTDALVCSPAMRQVMDKVERIAGSDATVLITGETGSGKEVIARTIHHQSPRCNKPWVDVNCGALPEHLIESELFGYEKGAFSGADTPKPGLFELAHGGTLFLDEIAELEPKLQVKLLRVLDGVPYYRLGGSRKVEVNVRVLVATNRPLEYEVRAGRFRKDLFHRLSQIQLSIPPLRERPEDVIVLAQHFLEQERPTARFSSDALAALQAYSWSGNVRELRNVVVHAAALLESDEIRVSDLPETVRIPARGRVPAVIRSTGLGDVEKKTILRTLAECGGHQGRAAQQLGISRRTLQRKLKQYRNVDSAGEDLSLIGSLRTESFRASLEIPVTVVSNHGRANVTSINLSVGGIGLQGISNPFQLAGTVQLSFTLPEDTEQLELQGQIAWADMQGKAGVRFAKLLPDAESRLQAWMRRQQTDLLDFQKEIR